ncbi:MAG: helix-turn-helix domain-containing protein [Streptosporangiaceae bacterium]
MPRPSSRDPGSDPRAFLGEELARARVAAGFSSQQALADHLGFDRSVVGKAESGDRPPTPEVLKAWCGACTLDYDHFARLAGLARRADGPVESWFVEWLEKEAAAQMIRAWSPVLLPGLLQTGEYARALFTAAGSDDDRADEQVAVRLGRQEILDRPRPPHVVALVDEAVLHRLIGSPQVMHDALVRVAELSRRPGVVVQVVPSAKGANAGLCGTFDLATAADGATTLRMDGIEDQTTENRLLVSKGVILFDLIRGDALPREESRSLILEIAEQWKSR